MAAPSEHESSAKKIKVDTEICGDQNVLCDGTFDTFSFKRVLRDDQRAKWICIEGSIKGSDEPAVVLLEKEHFQKECLSRILSKETSLKETLKNDIYRTYKATPAEEFTGFKSTLIYPATQKHIDKYCDHDQYIIYETPKLYSSVTLPCLEKSNFSLKWVYNILEKKSESDRIVFEDVDPETGFVLLPDMKWDGKDVHTLYLVAIVNTREIKSLRDLHKKHLPLLQNILDKGTKAVSNKYGVSKHQQRVYIHYQPSYYHLHVHFTHLHYEAPGTDTLRAHLLQDVIDNIQMFDDFYKNKTLMFSVRENHDLYKAYKEAGYFE